MEGDTRSCGGQDTPGPESFANAAQEGVFAELADSSSIDAIPPANAEPSLLCGLYLMLPSSSPVITSIDHLPEEVVTTIFSFLDRRSLLQASSTCHRWNRIASDDALWRSLYFLRSEDGDVEANLLFHHHQVVAEDSKPGTTQTRRGLDNCMLPPPSLPYFLYAPTRSWRVAEAWRRARDDQWRALVTERDCETEAMRLRLQMCEEDIAALSVCCEGLEAEQALRFEAELALRSARTELEDASYELMGRTHRLEEKTEEAARLARALAVAEKGREEEKRRADALEREARALRERCEAAERSLDLAAKRWAEEKKTRKELLDLLGHEQRSRSDLTRDTIAALLKQLLAPPSSSPSSSYPSRPFHPHGLPRSSSATSAIRSPSSSSSSSSSLSTSTSSPSSSVPLAASDSPVALPSALPSSPPLASSLRSPRRSSVGGKGSTGGNITTPSSSVPTSTSPPKSSLHFPLKGQAKCNF